MRTLGKWTLLGLVLTIAANAVVGWTNDKLTEVSKSLSEVQLPTLTETVESKLHEWTGMRIPFVPAALTLLAAAGALVLFRRQLAAGTSQLLTTTAQGARTHKGKVGIGLAAAGLGTVGFLNQGEILSVLGSLTEFAGGTVDFLGENWATLTSGSLFAVVATALAFNWRRRATAALVTTPALTPVVPPTVETVEEMLAREVQEEGVVERALLKVELLVDQLEQRGGLQNGDSLLNTYRGQQKTLQEAERSVRDLERNLTRAKERKQQAEEALAATAPAIVEVLRPLKELLAVVPPARRPQEAMELVRLIA